MCNYPRQSRGDTVIVNQHRGRNHTKHRTYQPLFRSSCRLDSAYLAENLLIRISKNSRFCSGAGIFLKNCLENNVNKRFNKRITFVENKILQKMALKFP